MVCDLTRERTHGRRVAWCFLDGQDVAEALIKAGLARDWPRFSEGRKAKARDADLYRLQKAVETFCPSERSGAS